MKVEMKQKIHKFIQNGMYILLDINSGAVHVVDKMIFDIMDYFDGENDGLVGKDSFPWGAHFTYLTVKGKRGISHGDMIDLNRENFDGFDVREFYVQLLYGLKKRGF